MNSATVAKYLAGGLLIGSVFALVWVGKVDASTYVGLVGSAGAALGFGALVVNRTAPADQPKTGA